jgi:branched-chain amino acid transport system permease protein
LAFFLPPVIFAFTSVRIIGALVLVTLRRRTSARGNGSISMAYFIQQLINGITLGMVYGLIAIGYTMVYGIVGMINFAHGEIYMIGAFLAVIGFTILGTAGVTSVPLALAVVLVLAMLITATYGWTLERVAYRPLRGSPRLAPLISAIGASIFLQNYVQLAQGARVKPVAPLISGGFTVWEDAGFAVHLTYVQLLIWLLTLVLMVAFAMLVQRTAFGRAQRAVAQDQVMARLVGIDVDRTVSATFVLGAALAAVAGVLVTLYYGVVDFFIGFLAGLKAFTAAVLGGIGSLPGAMLGGLLLGLIEAFWAGYFSAEYKDVAAFAILVIVLIFKPSGLLGREEVEKV